MLKISSLKSVIISLLSILFLVSSSSSVYSATFFTDHFSSLDTNTWLVYYNLGKVSTSNSFIDLASNTLSYTMFPYIVSAINPIPSNGDFEINLKIKRGSLGNFATSITLSTMLPVNGILADRYTNPTIYQKEQFISIILGKNNGKLQIAYCGDCYSGPCSGTTIKDYYLPAGQMLPSDLLFKVTYIGNMYKIYYMNISNNPVIVGSSQSLVRPNSIWFGSPYFGGVNTWTPLSVDYIIVSSFLPTPPIVFLPGYMASFDWEDMANNTSANEWQRNPLEKVYDNLFATLNALGYSEANGKLKRWDYDFRRPLPETAHKFKAWLDTYTATLPPDQKVILVGHSFGGLVARQYLQDNASNRVEKLITVASPHEGVLDTYPMLAGGEMEDAPLWQKAIFEAVMSWHGKTFLSKRQAVENVLLSARDLIPIFSPSFLKDVNGTHINSSFNNPNLLNLKNNNLVPLSSMQILRSTGIPTKNYYRMGPRGFLNQVLGDWPDGVITASEMATEGDGMVLSKSANIAGVTIDEIQNLNHTEIVSSKSGIDKILHAAQIEHDDTVIISPTLNLQETAIFFLLKSPATLKVRDTQTNREIGAGASLPPIEGAISAFGDKMIFVPTADQKRYQVQVVGAAAGEYELSINSLRENSPPTGINFKRQTEAGKTDVYEIKYENGGNLVHLTDVAIINPYDSAKKLLSEFPPIPEILDLTADCDLIKNLVEVKQDGPNALRQVQKMLKKTFALRGLTQDIELRNRLTEVLKMEREMFKIINNQFPRVTTLDAQHAQTSLSQILLSSENKLAIKTGLTESDAASFKTSKELQTEASRELAANLSGQSFFSSQISRFFAIEALK